MQCQSAFAQTDPVSKLKNWLEKDTVQNPDWGTWSNAYKIIPYTESPAVDLGGNIDAIAESLTANSFSEFPETGLIYVGSDIDDSEIMTFSKLSDTELQVGRGTQGSTAVSHAAGEQVIVKPNDVTVEPIVSQLATLTATKALLQVDPGATSASLQKAVSWIETQDFRNTEYLARQIEILAMAGRNCDGLLDKLLSWRLSDNDGWGENQGYKSNSVDTVWAIRALLAAGYRNDSVIASAFNSLVSHSSKDPNDATDSYIWSTCRPLESPWIPRKTSSVITATVYETLMEYANYLDTLSTAVSRASITSDCQEHIEETLSDTSETEPEIHEKAILNATLKRFEPTNQNLHIDALIALCEEDIAGDLYYLSDPYLTALILDAASEADDVLTITSVTIDDSVCTANICTTAWKSAKFYYKPNTADHFVLFDIQSNTTTSDLVTSDKMPYVASCGDTYAVWVDNQVWKESNYSTSTVTDIAVYDKHIAIFDNEGTIIPNNIILKNDCTSLEIRQKIHNLGDAKITGKTVSVSTSLPTSENGTVNLQPFEITEYSSPLDISSASNGVVNITINVDVSGDDDTSNNMASTQLRIIDPASTTIDYQLLPPDDLKYRLLENNIIELYWEPPLNTDVFGYQIGYAPDILTATTFFAATRSTSITYPLTEESIIFRVYSFNANCQRSDDYAEITIDLSTNPLIQFDSTPPYVAINYPSDGQIISTVRENASEEYGNLVVYGTVIDNTFDRYEVELVRDDGGTEITIDGIEPDDESPVTYGILAVFDLDTANIVSDAYTLRVNAYDLASNSSSESISINIYKWSKVLVKEGNACTSPTIKPNADQSVPELIYSSYQFSSTNDNDGYISNLWQYTYDSTSPEYSQLTDTYTNDTEPDWITTNEVLFTSYRTGSRNLVIRNDAGTTPKEQMINVLYDNNGFYMVDNESVDLLDADNEQVLFPKSFYNPDCFVHDGSKHIVASDELGELVLITDEVVDNLTLGLQEVDGKTFLLADKPTFGHFDDTTNECIVFFEGYDIQLPENYETDSYYINSDIYSLKFTLPEINSFGTMDEYQNLPTRDPNWLCAYGAYQPAENGILKSVSFYIEGVSGGAMTAALYSDNNGIPGSCIAVTEQVSFYDTTDDWLELKFTKQIPLYANASYWVAHVHTGSVKTPYESNGTGENFKIYYTSHSADLPFPELFPVNLFFFQKYSIKINYITPDEKELCKLTHTDNISETSPIWLGDNIEDSFNVSIAYVSDKDINNDGIPEWNIYFAQITGLDSSSPSLTHSTPITNAVLNDSDGIVYSLDFNNGILAYDEETYLPDDETFEKRIWYLKMEQ